MYFNTKKNYKKRTLETKEEIFRKKKSQLSCCCLKVVYTQSQRTILNPFLTMAFHFSKEAAKIFCNFVEKKFCKICLKVKTP